MLKNKLEKRLKIIVLLAICFLFWLLLFFVGFFFASNPIFYLITFVLAFLVGLVTFKMSKRLAVTLFLITVAVIISVFHFGFEEDYCVKKGEKEGQKMIIATKEDALALKAFDVKEGATIGANFRTHMICHTNFNLIQTFTNSILPADR